MPDLYLPISFGKHNLANHVISVYLACPPYFVSGAFNGNIVLYHLHRHALKPALLLSPHVLYQVGSVTALLLIRRPFSEFQTSGKQYCLLSIHQDKRVRLWNLEDGRLFQISDHDPFVYTRQVTQLLHIGDQDTRFILCYGQGNHLYVYDLWKMTTCKIYSIPDLFISVSRMNLNSITALDQNYRMYHIQTKEFLTPEKQNYMKYVDYKKTKKPDPNKTKKVSSIPSDYSLCGLPSKKLLHYHYTNSMLVLVYSKEVIFINQPFKETRQQREQIHLNCPRTKFKSVLEVGKYLLLETPDARYLIVHQQNVVDLFRILEKGPLTNINFSFQHFNFYKQS